MWKKSSEWFGSVTRFQGSVGRLIDHILQEDRLHSTGTGNMFTRCFLASVCVNVFLNCACIIQIYHTSLISYLACQTLRLGDGLAASREMVFFGGRGGK